MSAFHGDPKIKAKYLRRIRAHAKADRLIKGVGWEGGKGCAIGCTFEAYDHSAMQREWDVPEVLARLEDQIFERLPNSEAMKWPIRFVSAIPVGADTSKVWARFAVWMLCDLPPQTGEVKAAINRVIALLERSIAGDDPGREEWAAAAWAAPAAAAWAAAGPADGARAAAAATEAAAWAAARAAPRARSFWLRASKQLLALLRAAPAGGPR